MDEKMKRTWMVIKAEHHEKAKMSGLQYLEGKGSRAMFIGDRSAWEKFREALGADGGIDFERAECAIAILKERQRILEELAEVEEWWSGRCGVCDSCRFGYGPALCSNPNL